MAIKLDCPRCKTRLHVPSKLADSYVHCPQCKGRVWVAREPAAPVTPAAPASGVELVERPATPAPAVAGRSADATVPAATGRGLTSLPPVPARRKKVARFITAEAAQSTLQPAADGKLPDLQLEEGAAQQKPQAGQHSMNPLVLLGVLSASVAVSILLVLVGIRRTDTATSQRKDEARQVIESKFFGAGNIENKGLEPYQVLLREAQRARSRGDFATERQHYRRVLDMLRAERGADEKGLTGSHRRDKELEEEISVLLGGP
jgi:hypothetical protein